MKASELRIGNWVKGAFDCEIQVTASGILNFFHGMNYLKPIPLTEGWLLKFGFEWNGFEYEKGSFLIRNDFLVHNLGGYKIFVGNVHQLQNLYHALTGHELKTKQDDK